MAHVELRVPELGDFEDVEIIEVLVGAGDRLETDDPVITLETDKASMDVPATASGTVVDVAVKVGDRVSAGDLVLTLEEAEEGFTATIVMPPEERASAAAKGGSLAGSAPQDVGDPQDDRQDDRRTDATYTTQLVVIGAGPGGYTAAFRAADLGLSVILVERYPTLGGVCTNVGCIPSKALLHAAKVIDEAADMAEKGIDFGVPRIDTARLLGWKESVVARLTGGLAQLAKARKVQVVQAKAVFDGPHRLRLDNGESVAFEQCIIAAGSQSMQLPGLPDDPRIVDSTGALDIDPLPSRMLVVGGGIIGLEMACVYDALGVEVSVVELLDGLMPGTDPDLVRPFQKRIAARYESIMLATKVSAMEATNAGIEVSFEGRDAPIAQVYDRVLIAVGRRANGDTLEAEKAGVAVDERGIIAVDKQMRTNVAHIFAVGDLAGGPMLAHKATHEAKVAAEVAAGHKSAFDARTIPSVAYTDPEVAWVGLTETDAKRDGIDYEKAQFPWAASGRALSLGRDDGFTKLLFDRNSGRVLGGGIVGPQAGDLISEVALAIEMGADAADVGLTIHPHPTLSETVAFAAEAFEGSLTDLYLPKKKSR